MTNRTGVAGVLMVLMLVAPARAQNAPSRTPDRADILAAAQTIVGKARFATFVSLDDTGHPQARIVDPFAPDDDFTIWVATNPLSRKIGQIAADSRVTLTYFDAGGQSYVTVIGTARVVRDAQENAKRWKEEWAAIYKDKNRGDDYVLIRIAPTRIEVASVALGMINDPATWRPVTLDLPRR